MKIIISETQYNNIFINEQKTYKKNGYVYVEYNGDKYIYQPNIDSWSEVSRYDESSLTDVTDKDLIKKLITIYKNSTLYKKPINWVNSDEGKRIISELGKKGIKLYNTPKSMNHAYALATIESMKKITTLISSKIGGTNWNKYSICVKKVNGSCLPDRYANFDTFNLEMSKTVNSYPEKVDGLKSPYFMILENFYFDSGKIVEDLNKAFKNDKNANKSELFPDGWWNWFTTYFGTDNYSNIVNNIKKIDYINLPKVTSKVEVEDTTSLLEYVGECFSDYHCAMDVASIAVLAIPAVGPIVSMGLDFINAAAYGVEASYSKTSEDRNAKLLAGGLTLLGGIFGGGVGQTRRLLKTAEKNPKIYNYVSEVLEKTKKELPQFKNLKDASKDEKLMEIYGDLANKYKLNNNEILVAHSIIKDFSKIDINYAKNYANALNKIDKKIGRANLLRIADEPTFIKYVNENNGDVVKALFKYSKVSAGKEFLTELGLFIALTELMEDPTIKKWIGETYTKLKYSGREDIRGLVEKEGFEWNNVKKLFGSDGSIKDNELLKKSWLMGWRPSEDILKTVDFLNNNPQLQTDTFKKQFEKFNSEYDKNIVRKITPKNSEDREEGVKYYDSQKIIDSLENMDDIITNDELESAFNVLKQYY